MLKAIYKSKSKIALGILICNIVQKLATIISVPFYTRVLTESQYGEYSVVQSYQTILIVFFTLNLFNSSYIAGLTRYEKHRHEYTQSLIILITVLTSFCSVLIIIWSYYISGGNIGGIPMKYLICMCIQIYGISLLNLNTVYERYTYNIKNLVIFSLGYAIILLSSGLLATTYSSVENRLDARIFSETATYIIIIGFLLYKFKIFRASKAYIYWREALMTNVPLIPHYLSAAVLTKADQIMIARYCGEQDTAYYSLIYQISLGVTLFTNTIKNTFEPEVYRAIKFNKNIRRKTTMLFILVVALCFLVIFIVPEIIYVIAPPNYMAAAKVAPPIIGALFFVYSYNVFSSIQFFYRKSINTAVASVVVAMANILLNRIFITQYGYIAAGYTTLVCYILFSIFHLIISNSMNRKLDCSKIFCVKDWLIISITVLILVGMADLLSEMFCLRYIMLIIVTVTLYLNRGIIHEILIENKK